MVSMVKIAITVAIVAVCVVALVVGIVLGTRSSCNSVEPPANLTIASVGTIISLGWGASEDAESCNVTYQIRYSVDDDEEEQIVDTLDVVHLITNVEPCSLVHIHVYSVGESGDVMEEHVMGNVTVMPLTVGVVTGLANTHNVEESAVVYSWASPAGFAKCTVLYNVNIEADKGETDDETDALTFSVPDEDYCFSVTVSITAQIGAISSEAVTSTYSTDVATPEGLSLASSAEDHTLTVTWEPVSRATECGITYRISRQIDEEDTEPIEESDTEATFYLAYCTTTSITVTAIATAFGKESIPTAAVSDEQEEPLTIDAPTGLQFADALEGGQTLTWTRSPLLDKCTISYTVTVVTDLDNSRPPITADVETLTIPNTDYCFTISAQVSAEVGDVVSSESESQDTTIILDTPDNFDIAFDDNVDFITATWTDDIRSSQCAISYIVRYVVGSEEESVTATTGTATVPFDYCATTEVSVIAISTLGEGVESEATTSLPATRGIPDTVDQVQNIQTTVNDPSIVVSWESPDLVSHCAILYSVQAANFDNVEDSCTSESELSCEITVPIVCPIRFTVTAVSIGETTITGTPADAEYDDCPADEE